MGTINNTKAGGTRVLVLLDCAYGKCGTVATLSDVDLAAAKEQGMVDPTPASVATGIEQEIVKAEAEDVKE